MELLKFRLQLLVILLTSFLGISESIVNFRASAQSRPRPSFSNSTTTFPSSDEFTLEEVQLSRHGTRTPTAAPTKEPTQDPELLLEATPPPPAFSASIAHSPDIKAPDMEQEFGSLEGSGDPQMDMIEFQKLVAKEQQEQDLENLHQLPKGLELIDLNYGVFKDLAEDQNSGRESRRKEVVEEATSDTAEDAPEQESDSDEEPWRNGKFSML